MYSPGSKRQLYCLTIRLDRKSNTFINLFMRIFDPETVLELTDKHQKSLVMALCCALKISASFE